ncbi:MAG: 3-phosphoglycerate dehydrogenase [Ruminococcaceae bacterium]|nr:3-phosphoglycerate dehydrogenase [Oscillospiraceae bacterium]
MYRIKTYNKISKVGLQVFDDKYTVGNEVENADGAIVRSAALHDEVFPKTLLGIARAGAGTNNIPIDRCSEEGIVVFNTPGANANAVKELVIAGLFLASRKIVSGIAWANTLKGTEGVEKAVEKGKGAFAGPEIKGKTLGVIGLGAIGAMVANTASDLGMKVYGYDPYLSVKSALNLNHSINYIPDLKDIFRNCDYITVHVPLLDSTKNLIGAESIALMKDGVRILNFSRGGLVNSEAMLSALASGKVASYVTDFPSEEMLGVDGVVAIPHLGASTPESEDNCALMAAKELIDYIENGNIENSVNLPAISMPRSSDKRICVIHKNIPNMLTTITGIIAADGVNIENMLNRSKGDYAYTMLDVAPTDYDKVCEQIKGISGVIRVRVI